MIYFCNRINLDKVEKYFDNKWKFYLIFFVFLKVLLSDSEFRKN